jgi:hypothetical protein
MATIKVRIRQRLFVRRNYVNLSYVIEIPKTDDWENVASYYAESKVLGLGKVSVVGYDAFIEEEFKIA